MRVSLSSNQFQLHVRMSVGYGPQERKYDALRGRPQLRRFRLQGRGEPLPVSDLGSLYS